MAAKVLVCFAGPLDGSRVSVSSYMKKVADGQGGAYYRKKFNCEGVWKEALVYGPIDLSGIDLEVICRSCDGDEIEEEEGKK